METLLQDLRYSLRTLAKAPGFAAMAVMTLALGIGASTAIFSVVNSVLLQPLAVRDGNRLVVIWVSNLQRGWSRVGPTGQDYLDWQQRSTSFADLFLFEHGTGTVTGQGEPEQVAGLRVTTNFGDFLGVKPLLGRTFRRDEARGRHNLMILSSGYWQRRFAASPAVLGKAITLNGDSYTIIGVLPATLHTLVPADVVVPFDSDWVRRADSRLGVFGRLGPGVSLASAAAEMKVISEQIGRQRPERKGWGVVLVPLAAVRVEYIRPALLVLLGAVGFLLLIACANVANLLLARAVAREKEGAVRIALGAGISRLIRQSLTESALLALAGGAAGLLVAFWGTALLMNVLPERIQVPNAADEALLPKVHMDGTVLLYALGVSLLTAIIFGLVPAFQSARCNVHEVLKQGGRSDLAGPRGHRARAALVIAEAALAFVLLIGAGLTINSFRHLLASNPGFNPDHLLTVQIKLPNDAKDSKYREPSQQAAAFQRFLQRVEALPGVRAAGLTEIVPLSQYDMDMGPFVVQEAAPPAPGEQYSADFRNVSPGFFTALGTPLVRGRFFADGDDAAGRKVIIIDETLARHYFPHQDPIGRHLQMTDATHRPREIVGVVGGVRDTGYDRQPRPTIYFPFLQEPAQSMGMVIRTALPPDAALPAVKKAIWSVDKDQPIFNVKTMDEIIAGAVSAQRISFVLLGVFSSLALALAALGLYGVTSYAVSQRTHEIGVRMALGAGKYDVFRLAVGKGLTLTAAGVALGAGAALALTRFLTSILYGIRPTDPWTFLAVAAVLISVAALASYVPARRATEVDPLVALRHD